MKSSGQIRDEILDAASRLFARYGFKKTSIDDVATAARIGKGSVYLHFASKEEIFAEVVRRISEQMLGVLVAAVERAPTPAEKVRAFIEAKQATLADLAEEFHLGKDAILELFPAASDHRQAHDAREHALLVDVLTDETASDAFTVADPERLATGILACLTALETSSVVKSEDAEIQRGFEELVAVLVRGLDRVPPPKSSENGEAIVSAATPHEE